MLVATFHARPVSWVVAAVGPLLSGAVFSLPLPGAVVRRLLAGTSAPRALIEAFQAAVASVDPVVLADRARSALAVDVSTDVTRAQVPMLFIRATRDALIRETVVDELRVLNPSIEVTEIIAPHLVLQVAPEASAAVIAAFVDRQAR